LPSYVVLLERFRHSEPAQEKRPTEVFCPFSPLFVHSVSIDSNWAYYLPGPFSSPRLRLTFVTEKNQKSPARQERWQRMVIQFYCARSNAAYRALQPPFKL